MRAVTASTTSTSAICRRRSWIVTSRPPRKSAAWRSGARSPLCRTTSFACRPISRRKISCPGCRSARAAACRCPIRFAQDGEYEIQISLDARSGRNRQRVARGRSHEMLVLLDREPVETFTISRSSHRRRHAERKDFESAHYREGRPAQARRHIRQGRLVAGRNAQAATQSRFNDRRHPRTAPAIDQISVTGPYAPKGAGDTPSRRRLFVCRPNRTRQSSRKKSAQERFSPR